MVDLNEILCAVTSSIKVSGADGKVDGTGTYINNRIHSV